MFDFRYEKSQDIAGIRKVHESAVVVLGHPGYYPRFGFVPSIKYNITSEYDVPSDVFMIKELQPGVLAGISGIAKYHKAFAGL
jgi:putative acetyltransferase